LRRARLNRRAARLVVLEPVGVAQGVLTGRTGRRHTGRHLEGNRPGDLLSLDRFCVGKLKGAGKVWPITACDVATSYGWAQVVAGEVTADHVLAFLTTRVLAAYRAAGWTLQTVLTDNGKEFQTVFDRGCDALGLQHRRTKPRRAWTNGAVERFQGTILHEHWRVAFRREYFGRVRALQRSLDGFLGFYNRQRSHHGHRLNGRTPASAFPGGPCVSEHAGLTRDGRRAQRTRGRNCQHRCGTGQLRSEQTRLAKHAHGPRFHAPRLLSAFRGLTARGRRRQRLSSAAAPARHFAA
jgi:hypothetical protein